VAWAEGVRTTTEYLIASAPVPKCTRRVLPMSSYPNRCCRRSQHPVSRNPCIVVAPPIIVAGHPEIIGTRANALRNVSLRAGHGGHRCDNYRRGRRWRSRHNGDGPGVVAGPGKTTTFPSPQPTNNTPMAGSKRTPSILVFDFIVGSSRRFSLMCSYSGSQIRAPGRSLMA
jgi:hypothetical protein